MTTTEARIVDGCEIKPGASLRGASLRGASLRGADLRHADLRRAILSDADLSDADLGGAILGGADLRGANLGGADLGGADLRGADLLGANLGGADLGGADLSDDTILPTGERWCVYVSDVVPALIAAGVAPASEVLTREHWSCHTWLNCPMAAVFGAARAEPLLLRPRVDQFVQLFDAGLIPLNRVREACGLAAVSE